MVFFMTLRTSITSLSLALMLIPQSAFAMEEGLSWNINEPIPLEQDCYSDFNQSPLSYHFERNSEGSEDDRANKFENKIFDNVLKRPLNRNSFSKDSGPQQKKTRFMLTIPKNTTSINPRLTSNTHMPFIKIVIPQQNNEKKNNKEINFNNNKIITIENNKSKKTPEIINDKPKHIIIIEDDVSENTSMTEDFKITPTKDKHKAPRIGNLYQANIPQAQEEEEDSLLIGELIHTPYSENTNCTKNMYGVDQDVAKMFLNQINNIEGDHANALYSMGLYFEGQARVNNTRANNTKALEYFELAGEELHHAEAKRNLDRLQENITKEKEKKKINGLEQNAYRKTETSTLKERRKDIDAILDEEKIDVDVIYGKGLAYETGLENDYGIKTQNSKKAFEHYKNAAKQGHIFAQYNVGISYEEGIGVERNLKKAKKYYKMAAKQDNPFAQFHLGYLYDKGLGVTQNYKKAAKHYKAAADQNHAEAQCNIGILCENVTGCEMNVDLAVEYYNKSAEQNNDNALYYLGICYEEGISVGVDIDMAKMYYEKAAKLGHVEANNTLNEIINS